MGLVCRYIRTVVEMAWCWRGTVAGLSLDEVRYGQYSLESSTLLPDRRWVPSPLCWSWMRMKHLVRTIMVSSYCTLARDEYNWEPGEQSILYCMRNLDARCESESTGTSMYMMTAPDQGWLRGGAGTFCVPAWRRRKSTWILSFSTCQHYLTHTHARIRWCLILIDAVTHYNLNIVLLLYLPSSKVASVLVLHVHCFQQYSTYQFWIYCRIRDWFCGSNSWWYSALSYQNSVWKRFSSRSVAGSLQSSILNILKHGYIEKFKLPYCLIRYLIRTFFFSCKT